MKYIIILIISCFSLYSCTKTPQKRELTFEQQQERIRLDSLYLLYDSMPPRFDIKAFNKKRKDKDSYGFYEGDSLYIEYSLSKSGFTERKVFLESSLMEYIKYDSLGILQKSYKRYSGGWTEGSYFFYDKEGKLTNITQDDSHFAFTEEDLMNFAYAMGVKGYRIFYGINYNTIINRHYWYLHEQVRDGGLERIFHLDAITGELLDYMEYNYGDVKYIVWKRDNIIIDDEVCFF